MYAFSYNKAKIQLEVIAKKTDTITSFYDTGIGLREEQKLTTYIKGTGKLEKILFSNLPIKETKTIRIDFGANNQQLRVLSMNLITENGSVDLLQSKEIQFNGFEYNRSKNNVINVTKIYQDPSILIQITKQKFYYTSSDKFLLIGAYIFLAILLLFIGVKKIGMQQIEAIKGSMLFFSLSFLVFISIQPLFLVMGLPGNNFDLEKRMPNFFPKKIDASFFQNFEAWYTDNMVLRQKFTRLKSYQGYFIFHKSILPKNVVFGKDKEMFPTSEFILNDYKSEMELDLPQLMSMRQIFLEKIAYMQGLGKDYYLLLPANKHTIYSDLMQKKYQARHDLNRSMLSQFLKFIAKDSILIQHVIDTRPVLLNVHKKYPNLRIYYKNDLHWNSYGAFFAYSELMNKISIKHPSLRPLSLNDFKVKRKKDALGDMARLLLLHDLAPRVLYQFETKKAPSYQLYEILGKTLNPIYRTTSANKKLPKVLVFRDSFCQDMIQFLALHFSDALFVWDQNFSLELIKEQNPDIVIQEVTEMFIYDLLRINPKPLRN